MEIENQNTSIYFDDYNHCHYISANNLIIDGIHKNKLYRCIISNNLPSSRIASNYISNGCQYTDRVRMFNKDESKTEDISTTAVFESPDLLHIKIEKNITNQEVRKKNNRLISPSVESIIEIQLTTLNTNINWKMKHVDQLLYLTADNFLLRFEMMNKNTHPIKKLNIKAVGNKIIIRLPLSEKTTDLKIEFNRTEDFFNNYAQINHHTREIVIGYIPSRIVGSYFALKKRHIDPFLALTMIVISLTVVLFLLAYLLRKIFEYIYLDRLYRITYINDNISFIGILYEQLPLFIAFCCIILLNSSVTIIDNDIRMIPFYNQPLFNIFLTVVCFYLSCISNNTYNPVALFTNPKNTIAITISFLLLLFISGKSIIRFYSLLLVHIISLLFKKRGENRLFS